MIWAVVPAKLATSAKERLGPVLSPPLRERLARAMLSDVVGALVGCPAIDRTVVISRDAEALALARDVGAAALEEQTTGGLNASVVEAVTHCSDRGASTVVVAMGDLPLLSSEDVARTVSVAPDRGLVLVPSADGTGTNVVVARPPELFAPQFGPGSLAKHRDAVRAGRIEAILHECPGAALDVDTPEDLERLRTSPHTQAATRELLATTRKLVVGREARATLGAS